MRRHLVNLYVAMSLGGLVLACAALTSSGSPDAVVAARTVALALPPPPLHAQTVPAAKGAVLRVFVDPAQIVGWVAGGASFAGTDAVVRIAGRDHRAAVGADNTFVVPYAVAEATDAVVTVGELVQRVTLAPVKPLEPTVFFIVDRTAYRPGQQLAFAGFLRRLDADGEFRPIAHASVEVRITADTKNTVAAKLAVTADAAGRIAGDYTFSPGDPLDGYTLAIAGYRGTASVTHAEYRKSKVKLDVDGRVGERELTLRFTAVDFLEQPVAGGRVSFTAQVVRDGRDPAATAGGLVASGFAYGAPADGLDRDERLLFAADPVAAGRLEAQGIVVIEQLADSVELSAKGAGTRSLPVKSEWLRGRHAVLVDAVIVDANGREQRVTERIPLGARDARVVLGVDRSLVAAGEAVDVDVRVVDAAGKPVMATTSVVAMRLEPTPRVDPYGYAYGGAINWNLLNVPPSAGWNGNLGPVWLGEGSGCQYTAMGCLLQRGRHAALGGRMLARPAETLASVAGVVDGAARLVLGDAGAYKLIARAQLADGTSVWSEVGVAVRARDALPELALALDADVVRHGGRLRGWLDSRYADAAALVVVRDARGVRQRHRVVLAHGQARLDLPITGDVRAAATVEAYILGDAGVLAAQDVVHVIPTHREVTIATRAKDTYGPGETVELAVHVNRAESVDLVVSVYDQALLGVAPDRSVDVRSFYLADDRVRTRPALAPLRARLGDVTVGDIEQRARAAAKTPADSGDAGARDPERVAATELVALLDAGRINATAIVGLLRFAGIDAVDGTRGYSSWQVLYPKPRKAALARTRVVDLVVVDGAPLGLELVADTIIVSDPAADAMTHVQGPPSHGAYARGDSQFSASGNASFSGFAINASAPARPSPIDVAGGAAGADVVRRDFSDSAFWSGHLRTGADGSAMVRFKLPDSLTNWQVVITAVTRDMRVGEHRQRLRTVRPVMVWPMIPRLFTEGDTVSVFATVHNQTDAEREILVSLEADNARVLSARAVKVRVPAHANRPVYWSVRAGQPGQLALLMKATALDAAGAATDEADASLKRLPVVASAADQIVTASGFTDKALVVEVPDGIDPRSASLEITFAPSLAADLATTLDYLVEYPYGCAEQTMSRFVPAIKVAGVLDRLQLEDSGLARRLPGVVEGGIKRLIELQQEDGGWGWHGSGATHEMMTPYVLWGLLEAEHAGYRIPDDRAIKRGLARLRAFVTGGSAQLADRVYLMYVYAQRDKLPDAWWRSLVERRAEMSDYALALTLELAVARDDRAVADSIADALRRRAVRSSDGARWRTAGFSRWMDDPLEITAAVLKALVAYDVDDALIPEVIAYFVANKRGDRWNSTKDTAMILFAMTDYLGRKGMASPSSAPFVEYAVGAGAAARVAFADGLTRKVMIDGGRLSRRTVIAFPEASPGMMARAVLRYRKTGRDLAPAAHGLAVTRAMFVLDAKGGRVRELRSGDAVPRGSYVESVVTVAHEHAEAMRYLLIEDAKPAGAEALPDGDARFTAGARTPPPYVLREDREAALAYHHEATPASTSVRAVLHLELAGDLAVPPAQAELMYQTQTRGHSGSFLLRVE